MRALWIKRHGGPSVLEVRESPDPTPGPGEVRIAVRACGLNFAELTARQGLYPDAPKPPCVVGYEGAGEIDALGEGVSLHEVGQRVMFMKRFGAFASSVCVPAAQVFRLPDAMSFEEGAAIPVNYLTAYHMIFRVARVRSGDHVLVHMAAGGVGTAALQLLSTIEGVTTYGTASAGKHEYVRSHGCDHPIDYRNADYAEEVRKLSGGRGMDAIFDALGGRDWKKGYDLLNEAGVLVAFGMANVQTGGKRNLFHVLKQLWDVPKFSPMDMMSDNRGVAGVNLGHLWHRIDMLAEELEDITRLHEAVKVTPYIDGVYPFSESTEAFGRLEWGKNQGKVILVP